MARDSFQQTKQALENEIARAFPYQQGIRPRDVGVCGVCFDWETVEAVHTGRISASVVVEAMTQQLPCDVVIYDNPTGKGLRQKIGINGTGSDELYMVFYSREWEVTPVGGAFGAVRINL